jgi:Family of unknown function (DUF6452)
MKKILFLLFIAITLSSCEKDDICDANTSTTPRLVIDFYDANDPTELKNVVNLKVIGDGETVPLVLNESGTEITKYLGNGSSVKLPLKTTEDVTKYHLIINSTSTTSSYNEDMLQFDYTRQTIYVSRACGYKVIYDLDPTTPVTKTDAATPDGYWIQDINIQTTNITTENETHIKVYIL